MRGRRQKILMPTENVNAFWSRCGNSMGMLVDIYGEDGETAAIASRWRDLKVGVCAGYELSTRRLGPEEEDLRGFHGGVRAPSSADDVRNTAAAGSATANGNGAAAEEEEEKNSRGGRDGVVGGRRGLSSDAVSSSSKFKIKAKGEGTRPARPSAPDRRCSGIVCGIGGGGAAAAEEEENKEERAS